MLVSVPKSKAKEQSDYGFAAVDFEEVQEEAGLKICNDGEEGLSDIEEVEEEVALEEERWLQLLRVLCMTNTRD